MQAALLELPVDLSREARALEGLKIALETGCGLDIDPDFLHDLAEGQTNLFEAIDALLHDDLQDRMLLEGVKFVLKDLQARQDRSFTPAILAMAYHSLVSSSGLFNRLSSGIGCGARHG